MIYLLLWALACTTDDPPDPPDQPADGPAEQAPAAGEDTGAAVMGVTGAESEDADAERAVARHILIQHKFSRGLTPPARTQDEARDIAEDVRERVLAGEDMAQLAKEFSDDGSSRRGGFLGSATRGNYVPAFEDALWGLPIGGVSEVVETEFGMHVIRREALEEYHLLHILVQHEGVQLVDQDGDGKSRSEQDAEARAREALAAIQAGEDFPAVAARYSDGPMALRGADLGWVLRGELGPVFDAVVTKLEVGEVSEPVKTVFGYHVVKRLE